MSELKEIVSKFEDGLLCILDGAAKKLDELGLVGSDVKEQMREAGY